MYTIVGGTKSRCELAEGEGRNSRQLGIGRRLSVFRGSMCSCPRHVLARSSTPTGIAKETGASSRLVSGRHPLFVLRLGSILLSLPALQWRRQDGGANRPSGAAPSVVMQRRLSTGRVLNMSSPAGRRCKAASEKKLGFMVYFSFSGCFSQHRDFAMQLNCMLRSGVRLARMSPFIMKC